MRTPVRTMHLLVLCAALAVAGCTTKPDSVTTPDAVESWSAEDEAEAVQEAEQAVRDWMRTSSQCLDDPPNTDPSCFDEVSYGTLLRDDRAALEYAQENGVRYIGEATYVRTDRVVKVDLSIGPDKEVRLAGCQSIEGFDILYADGTSMISDWPRRERFIYVVLKHTSKWQLADILEDPEGSEC